MNNNQKLSVKPQLHLADKSFAEHKAVQYKLYVQVSKSTIKLLILDEVTSTFIALKIYQLNDVFTDYALAEHLQAFIKADSWINLAFKNVIVAFENNRSTLIPNALFNKEEIATYHQFNFTPLDSESYLFDKLLPVEANTVYSLPTYVVACFETIKNKQIIHFSTPLITAALLQSKKSNTLSSITVHVLPTSFQLIHIKNQQLELYNSFEYQTSEDFIYYLLFVLEQQKIDHQKVTLNLLGEVEKNSAIYTLLLTYINEVKLISTKEMLALSSLKLSYIFDETNPPYYYSLFQHYLCE